MVILQLLNVCQGFALFERVKTLLCFVCDCQVIIQQTSPLTQLICLGKLEYRRILSIPT